jgi:hypothetical protein
MEECRLAFAVVQAWAERGAQEDLSELVATLPHIPGLL